MVPESYARLRDPSLRDIFWLTGKSNKKCSTYEDLPNLELGDTEGGGDAQYKPPSMLAMPLAQ